MERPDSSRARHEHPTLPRLLAALLATVVLFGPLGAGRAQGADLPDEVRIALVGGDTAMALEWLEAHPDDPDAAFELGKLYSLGRGVPKDPGRAAALFDVAARAGNPEASYLLGKKSERGGDAGAAARWMRRAAELGHARAAEWLRTAPVDAAQAAPPSLHAAIRAGAAPRASVSAAQLATRDAADRTPLMLAAESGSPEWTAALLAAGAAVDERDQYGNTALHFAAGARHAAVAEQLLEAGADPDAGAGDGSTALHLAVGAADTHLVRLLLNHGATRDRRNAAGWTPVMLAARSDDSALTALLGTFALSDNLQDSADEQDLSVQLAAAARRGDVPRAAELLKRGADPNATDNAGLPALAHAARADRAAVVELLLRSGASCAAELSGGQSVLHLAAGAAAADSVAALLGAGCAADARDAAGRSPVLLAVEAGCGRCVDVLVDAGAAVSIRDSKGRTALIEALRRGEAVMARSLLRGEGPVDGADPAGRDALWWAARAGDAAIVSELLARGVRPVADREGAAPLHVAAELNHGEVVTTLLPVSERNARTAAGNTALLLAAHGKAAVAVEQLIAAGVDIEARNNTGDTALIAAVRAGDASSTAMLVRAGANPDIRNARFESARSLIEARKSAQWQALLESANDGLLGLLAR